ncbi:MAG: ChaN family lipoprotein [Marinobacter sp.]
MTPIKRLLASLTTAGLAAVAGCAQLPAQPAAAIAPPVSLYDSVLIDSQTARPISLNSLADRLAKADVVVIGEYHGHQASHLLQARLQQHLHRLNPGQVLSLEQFTLDHQPVLDDYLAGNTGETEMLEDAQAWDNYRGSYRPLVEFARYHNLPVIAANAPAQVIRCVGRLGPDYLDTLPGEQRLSLPAQAFLDTPAYREKFEQAISGSHGTGDPAMAERMDNTYKAQLLRDNTMAMRILQARDQYPAHQIVHLTGTFHSEERLGTVALLEHRAPDLSVVVISPVFWPADSSEPALADNLGKGDYLYLIQPLPPEFRDRDRERSAMQERFSRPDTSCDTR